MVRVVVEVSPLRYTSKERTELRGCQPNTFIDSFAEGHNLKSMLDAWIIEEIKRREQEREEQERPQLELPIPPPKEESAEDDAPVKIDLRPE